MQGTTELGNESGIVSEDAGLVAVGDHRDPNTRRNIRTTLAMLACVGIAVTMLWSFTMPNLRGPDEGQHLDLIFEMTENHSFTTSKDYKLHMRMYVIRAIAFHGDAGSLHGLGTAAKPRDQRPAFSATPDDRCVDLPPPNDIRCSNQLNQHPPLGWGSAVVGSELVGIFSEPSDWSYDKYLLLLRFLNALSIEPQIGSPHSRIAIPRLRPSRS